MLKYLVSMVNYMKKFGVLFSLIFMFAFFSAIFLPVNFFNNKKVNASTTEQSNFTNLIIFAKFDGESEFVDQVCSDTTTVKQLIENSYSLANYSVKDYFQKVSNGKVNIQNLYLFDKDGGSLTLSKKRGYYCTSSANNSIGYQDSDYSLRMNELKQDWSNAIQTAINSGNKISNLDGSKTYSCEDLDKNGDGYIDNITIIYKYASDFSTSWKDCLWNYQAFSFLVELNGNNGRVIKSKSYVQITYDYSFTYTNDSSNIKFANLKTMIHEMGHVFGLKDLYNSQSESPIHYMSIMSHSTPYVPQYLSSKEREILGWIEPKNICKINSQGRYTIQVTSSDIPTGIISYKCDIPSLEKTLYLEYRKFNGTTNKYDTQNKNIYNSSGVRQSTITSLKSGLVCFLLDKDTDFPNNMNRNKYNWNYEVLGGQWSTKTDSALATGDSLQISSNLSVSVISLTDNELTFEVNGTDISQEHTHSLINVEYKDSTCSVVGNIAYKKCTSCSKLFSINNTEIELKDTVIPLKDHTKTTVLGKTATCSEKGLTDGVKCSKCGLVLVEQTEIDKLAHISSDWIIDKNATTTQTGSKHKECVNCKTLLETKTIPIIETGDNTDKPSIPDNPTTPPKQDNQQNSSNLPAILIITFAGLSLTITITTLIAKKHKKRRKF